MHFLTMRLITTQVHQVLDLMAGTAVTMAHDHASCIPRPNISGHRVFFSHPVNIAEALWVPFDRCGSLTSY